MENWETFVKKTIELIGFKDFRVEIDNERNRGLVFIYDSPTLVKDNLAQIVESLNYVIQMAAKRGGQTPPVFDVNNYRQERENLIVELAKAAAKKVLATGENISLPVMNSYERRLIHMALAVHPEVTTESAGLSKERHVIIKLIR
ncbi:MAG: spoIIIJ-associated protein [Parcubacteria group bacterium Gr01-1014_20]|nr:MAG: spoIIIJ-associated protein [Parcubacteria group bacterium Gr01-1014_20]